MNKIGFASELVEPVLKGEKTVTYRLGDKFFLNFSEGLVVEAVNSGADTVFANLKILELKKVPLKEIPLNQVGHDSYSSVDELVSDIQKNYPHEHVSADSIISVVCFEVI